MYIATSAFRSSPAASGACFAVDEADPDARAREDLFAVDLVGELQRVQDPAAASAACAESFTLSSRTANSSPPKRATVSVGRTAIRSRRRDLLQHLVSGRVAEAVVDGLEVVQIDEDDSDVREAALRAHQPVLDAILEKRAIGEV